MKQFSIIALTLGFTISALVACGADDTEPDSADRGGSAGKGGAGKAGRGGTAGNAGKSGKGTSGSTNEGGSAGSEDGGRGGRSAGSGGDAGAPAQGGTQSQNDGGAGAGPEGGAGAGGDAGDGSSSGGTAGGGKGGTSTGGTGGTSTGGTGGTLGGTGGCAGSGGSSGSCGTTGGTDIVAGAAGADGGAAGAAGAADDCIELEVTSPWELDPDDEPDVNFYTAEFSPNLGTPTQDAMGFQVFADTTGTFLLGTGVDATFAQCERCLGVVFNDGTATGRWFFPDHGTLVIDETSAPLEGRLEATLTDVTFRETEYYFEEFMDGGQCLHLATSTISVVP